MATTETVSDAFASVVMNNATLNATANKNVGDGATHLRFFHGDNSGGAGAGYIQGHDAVNPTLGSAKPELVLPLPNSIHALYLVEESGGKGMPFASGLTYAMTDAADGSSLTGADRKANVEVKT